MADWCNEEIDNAVEADLRNFARSKSGTRDGSKIDSLLYAGNNLGKARSEKRALAHRGLGRWHAILMRK